MKRYVISYVLFVAIVGTVLCQDASRSDAERLQGEWILATVEIQGKTLPAPAGKGGSIVFAKDGMLIMRDPGKPDKEMKYRIDAAKNPRQIDLIELKDGKDGQVVQGIYEIEDDLLKLGFSADGSKGKRPGQLKGDKILIMHLKSLKQ
jgi:uncharacterized protein (TIGR03067 family)